MLQCVSQKVAQAIDVELMSSSGGFSIDQLMELGNNVHNFFFSYANTEYSWT